MKIELLDENRKAAWEDYVDGHPHATFYHRVGWKKVMEKSFGHKTYYLMALQDENITGILPLVHLKSFLFGSMLCSLPFMGIGGICADNDGVETALLDAAGGLLKELKGDYLELRSTKRSKADIPVKTHKVTMTVELDSDPELIWKNFKTKHRTAIRRAAKNELEIRSGTEEFLNTFYEIESTGWRDLGTPFYPKSFFKNIVNELGDHIEIFLVFYQGQPIATAFNGLFKDEVEGMWTYVLREHVKLQANYFLYWEMIRKACEKGYRKFHLGRSTTESGGAFYKSKWNAIPTQLYWGYVLNKAQTVPDLDVENPKYKRAIQLWKKLPVNLTRWIGPLLAKNIP